MSVKFRAFYYDGGWTARDTDHGIITQGESIGKLVDNILEAVELNFEDEIRRGEPITINVTTEPVPDFILELDEIDAKLHTQHFECQLKIDRNIKATGC